LSLTYYFIYTEGGLAGAGFESGLVEGAGGAYGSSSFESSSYSAGVGGGAGGYVTDGGFGGGYSSSSYESSGGAGGGGAAGFDVVAAAFNTADKNKDGTVDQNEFQQFYQGGL
jgi:hypothetical protein